MEGCDPGSGSGLGPDIIGSVVHLRLESFGSSLSGQRPEGEETTADCRENGFGAGEARQQGYDVVVVVFRFLSQDRQTRGFQTRVITEGVRNDERSIDENDEEMKERLTSMIYRSSRAKANLVYFFFSTWQLI